jgi:hypothetical protein
MIDWQAVSAVATAAAAVTTAMMVWCTRETLSQSEKHHRDDLRPLLVLAPPNGIEPLDRSEVLRFEQRDGKHILSLACELRNIGIGPALNPKLQLRVMGIEGYGFTKHLSPVRAGEALWNLDGVSAVTFEASPTENYNQTDHSFAPATLWELVLEYEDVFGRHFYTTHSKDALRPWTVSGTGSVGAGH